jgi:hypothetical protein
MKRIEKEIKDEKGDQYFRPGNLQYGGTNVSYGRMVMLDLKGKGLMGPDKKFGDVGAGIGRMLAYALAFTDVGKVIGIEPDDYLREKGKKAIAELDRLGILDAKKVEWVGKKWEDAKEVLRELDSAYLYSIISTDTCIHGEDIRDHMRKNAYLYDMGNFSGWGTLPVKSEERGAGSMARGVDDGEQEEGIGRGKGIGEESEKCDAWRMAHGAGVIGHESRVMGEKTTSDIRGTMPEDEHGAGYKAHGAEEGGDGAMAGEKVMAGEALAQYIIAHLEAEKFYIENKSYPILCQGERIQDRFPEEKELAGAIHISVAIENDDGTPSQLFFTFEVKGNEVIYPRFLEDSRGRALPILYTYSGYQSGRYGNMNAPEQMMHLLARAVPAGVRIRYGSWLYTVPLPKEMAKQTDEENATKGMLLETAELEYLPRGHIFHEEGFGAPLVFIWPKSSALPHYYKGSPCVEYIVEKETALSTIHGIVPDAQGAGRGAQAKPPRYDPQSGSAGGAEHRKAAECATAFADIVKYASIDEEKRPFVLALGTSWIKGYEKGRYLQYDALNPLITSIRDFCAEHGITFVMGEDASLLSKIDKASEGKENARIVVLAGEKTVKSDEFAQLRENMNAFLAGVDNTKLTVDSYIQLVEMMTIALKLSMGLDVDLADPALAVRKEKGYYLFIPDARPVDYEELKVLYELQIFA